MMEQSKILEFYADGHVEIRKFLEPICGPPDDPDDPGYYIITVEACLSEDPVIRHLDDLKAQHNVSRAAFTAREELMDRGILDKNGRLIDQGLPEDMQPGSMCGF